MLNRLFLFMVASYFLVGCTTESVDGFGKDNSLKDAVSVVYVKGAEDFCKTGDSTTQALSFKDFNSYEEFTRNIRTLSSAEREKVFKNLRFTNLETVMVNADTELDSLGSVSLSNEDFRTKYNMYKKKYKGVLVENKIDKSDLSLYVPTSNDEDLNPYIVGPKHLIFIEGKAHRVNFGEEMNSRDYALFKNVEVFNIQSAQKAMSRATVSSISSESDWPVNGFINVSGHQKLIFHCYIKDSKDVMLHFGAQKKMWYGWKRERHRNVFFRTRELRGLTLDYNVFEIGSTGKRQPIPGLNPLPPYPETYYFPSPSSSSEFAVISDNDFKFGKVNEQVGPVIAESYGVSGYFYIWTDQMTGSDSDLRYDIIPAGMPILDEKRSYPCIISL